MKKKWTKEEFIEECNKRMKSVMPHLLARQEVRRQWLKKRKRHAKSKLQRA
ncbi:MAG: hypothetical protein ACXABY_07910 [Candidatus Thorarchaeota archaeon]|jgi:hypothetical protein